MAIVLIAGGCGFIGSHLVDRLLARREVTELCVVDNLWTGLHDNIAHVRDRRLAFVQADAEHFRADQRFDEIYHLASPASPPWYMAEPLRTISANVGGALNLVGLLKKGGQIAYTSTSEVYGDPLVSPQPESYRGYVDCTGPRSSYDESKRCVESLLFEARRVHGVRVKVARLFNVFGPRTRVDDGRAVSNFITQGLRGLPITVYGDGTQTRSWTYIDDAVEALERFFWRDRSEFAGPVNVGTDREISVLDVAKYVQRRFPGSPIEFLPPTPQDPTNRRPELTLARQVIPGWSADVTYEDGVDRTIEWFRQRVGGQRAAVSQQLA
jgi:nucleoside-diphosphate-sugar epimerase